MKVYELLNELKDYDKWDDVAICNGSYIYEIFQISKEKMSDINSDEEREVVVIDFDEQIGLM